VQHAFAAFARGHPFVRLAVETVTPNDVAVARELRRQPSIATASRHPARDSFAARHRATSLASTSVGSSSNSDPACSACAMRATSTSERPDRYA
jgi:hypothetical protein